MSHTLEYNFKFNSNLEKINGAIEKLTGKISGAHDKFSSTFGGIQNTLNNLNFSAVTEKIERVTDSLKGIAAPGKELSTSLYDLQAITGVAGDKLEEISDYARANAKIFGGSAAAGVEGYKLILSQLTPEIAKVPSALDAMGNSVSTLSKTMGGNTLAATEVLTTAMNQFQVSTADPIAAADEMARMMNVMAAGAKEGSAELPQIKSALEQAGMAAKSAGLSFEETNAAIQVLDKAGKKGSEGGVAFRNVLATLSEGRFLPKDTQEALSKAGVSLHSLTNQSLPLIDRLNALRPIMGDTALVTKLFGKENSNAALAMLSGTDEIQRITSAITGTTAAYEQAAVVMESPVEKADRLRAKIDDLKNSLFNGSEGLLGYVDVLGDMTRDFTNLFPLLSLFGKITGINTVITALQTSATEIATGATSRWAVVQGALNKTMLANPLFRAIAIVTALAGVVIYAYTHFEKFRGFVHGALEGIKEFGSLLYDLVTGRVKELMAGIAGVGKSLYLLFTGEFSAAAEAGKNALLDMLGAGTVQTALNGGKRVANAYKEGFHSQLNQSPTISEALDSGLRQSGVLRLFHGMGIQGGESFLNGFLSKARLLGAAMDKMYHSTAFSKTVEAKINQFQGKQIELAEAPKGLTPLSMMETPSISLSKKDDEGRKDGSANSIATGGTKNTQITINIGKMNGIESYTGTIDNATQMSANQIIDTLIRAIKTGAALGA